MLKSCMYIGIAVAGLLSASTTLGAKVDPAQVLDRVDDLYRGEASHGRMTMKVLTEHWSRELKLEFWSEGTDKSLIRILSPKKEKGTATLRVAKDMWNYLPKVKRVIKVPGSMMGASWMGSHFTNDDLVRESRMADDFTFEITFEGKRDGKDMIEVTCVAKEDAAVVWGKVVVEVRSSDYLPLRMLYFDEDLTLARTMLFSEARKLGKRMVPTSFKIIPEGEEKEYTKITYDELELDVQIDDKLFTLRNLQR